VRTSASQAPPPLYPSLLGRTSYLPFSLRHTPLATTPSAFYRFPHPTRAIAAWPAFPSVTCKPLTLPAAHFLAALLYSASSSQRRSVTNTPRDRIAYIKTQHCDAAAYYRARATVCLTHSRHDLSRACAFVPVAFGGGPRRRRRLPTTPRSTALTSTGRAARARRLVGEVGKGQFSVFPDTLPTAFHSHHHSQAFVPFILGFVPPVTFPWTSSPPVPSSNVTIDDQPM